MSDRSTAYAHLTRRNCGRIRWLRRAGADEVVIAKALGLYQYSKVAGIVEAVVQDFDSGGHLYDPVDDVIAIDRVVHYLDGEVYKRMSVFERAEALARIWKSQPDWHLVAKKLGYRDHYAARTVAQSAVAFLKKLES